MEQTNKTILFEEINPNIPDLFMLIGDEDQESLSDEEIQRIHENLEVDSFEDFTEKFSPSVNMLLDTNNLTVKFSSEHLGAQERVVKLNTKNSLFSMLSFIMEARQEKKYVLTDFNDVMTGFIQQKDIRSFIEERNQIICCLYENDWILTETLERNIMDTITKFDDGILLLIIFLQENNSILISQENLGSGNKGIFDDKDILQIKVIKKSAIFNCTSFTYKHINLDKYRQLIYECVDKLISKSCLKNAQLIKDCFLLPALLCNNEYNEIEKKYINYCNLYTDIIKKFWISSKYIIETMLGIKSFFRQYGDTCGMSPKLVIANFRISKLINEKYKKKLDTYLKSVNTKRFYNNTIWYAIVPNVSIKADNGVHPVRERFKSNNGNSAFCCNMAEESIMLIDILSQYRIQSFLSFSISNESTFAMFAKRGIDVVNNSLSHFEKIRDKDFFIPCFPNFLVVYKKQACLNIGKKFTFNALHECMECTGENNIQLDEIGIEASYIAAGLVAACQCPNYLKKYFGEKVNAEIPGVAYRFTINNHNLITISDMLCELTEFPKDILDDAVKHSRGIMFGQQKNKIIMLTDRVFSYSLSNRLLVSMVQTVSYIERKIQYETQDFKRNLIIQFFQRKPGSIISKWYDMDRSAVNSIIKENEELEYRIDDTNSYYIVELRFGNDDLIIRENISVYKK